MQTLDERAAEVSAKLAQLRQVLAVRALEAVEIRQTANLAWLTAGVPTYINIASETSPVRALITAERAYLITDSIEAPRLAQECQVEALGFELAVQTWHMRGNLVEKLASSSRLGQDGEGNGANLAAELQRLRSTLMPSEIARLRMNSRLAAEAMHEAIRAVQIGQTEHDAAARLAAEVYERGGVPIVVLVASDERVFNYRHPLPTDKPIERYAMLVLCFRKDGLVISLTRLVHFGAVPSDLKRKAEACARVDARLILGTRAGRTLGDMFALARDAYADEGYPEAIDEHHQGGSAGYMPREVVARPDVQTPIAINQMFAWNPSIRGVKSEDSILLTENGVEILTAMEGFPTLPISIDGQPMPRPAILEV
ncbi:MAG: M24 family metallopeptidase [Anaerolineae bacterium]|nr:M24 family metallopeptidase [Anaerolineae bacterium]MDW8299211.1 M24 family metallopeptidase [Anaerolineae bacterium]